MRSYVSDLLTGSRSSLRYQRRGNWLTARRRFEMHSDTGSQLGDVKSSESMRPAESARSANATRLGLGLLVTTRLGLGLLVTTRLGVRLLVTAGLGLTGLWLLGGAVAASGDSGGGDAADGGAGAGGAEVCPEVGATFADVPEEHFAAADIGCLAALGIVQGTSADTFSPQRSITRAQAAALLARMWRYQGRVCPDAQIDFSDIPSGHFARADISCLFALGITKGTSADTFSPQRSITRAQAAALLARMWRYQGRVCPDAQIDFSDIPSGHFARADISCLFALGITKGTSATAFSPQRSITRAQAAALLARMMRTGASEDTETGSGGTTTTTLPPDPQPGSQPGSQPDSEPGYEPDSSPPPPPPPPGQPPEPVEQVPAAPTNVILTAGDRFMDVGWSKPAGSITGYEARHCVDSTGCDDGSEWTSETLTGTGTSTRISSLTNGVSYQVQVRASNSAGDGAWSQSAVEKPSTVPGAPGAPLLEVRHQSLSVSWSPPTADGGAAITGYRVGRCSVGCGTAANWTVATSAGTGTSFTLTGLTNGTAYQVRVAAGNRSGDGGWSASSQATPAPRPPGAPTAPTTTADGQSVVVSWSAPTSNGATITGYDVRYRVEDSDGAWPAAWTSHAHTGTATTAVIGNLAAAISANAGALTNTIEYQVQVRAINSVGVGTWSPQPPDTPGSPTLTARHQGLAVAWSTPTENGSAITGYDVRYRVKDTDSVASGDQPGPWVAHAHTGTATSATIGSLTNDTAYQVQVRAESAVGDSGWSASGEGTPASQPPDAPAAPMLTTQDQGLGVSWSAPTENGSVITGYDVRYRVKDTDSVASGDQPGTWVAHTHTGTATSATIGSLTNDTAYQVQVRAANSVGGGAWSALSNGTPSVGGTDVPQGPDAPGTPTVSALHRGLAVSWSAPAVNGSAVTDYDVRYRVCTATPTTCATNPTWGNWTDRSGETTSDTATSTTITGLTDSTAYQVQVRASSAAGDSGWSASAQGTPAPQKPDASAAPSLTVGNQSLGVSWSAPAVNGSVVTDYDVRYRVCTATPTTCATTPTWGNWTDRSGETTSDTATSVTITGLTNGTAYQVQMRAANSVGDSGWSASGQGVPAPQPPDVPAAPTVIVKNQSLGASWSTPSINGSVVTGYGVRYRTCTATPKTCQTNPAWSDWALHTHTGTATSATIGSLTNGTAYQVQIKAESAAGDSGWSASEDGVPAPQPPDAPAAPTMTVDNQVLHVSWDAPTPNGSTITDYDVQYRVKDTDSVTSGDQPGPWITHTHVGTATSATIGSLTNGTAYQVQVRAVNSIGDSGWSASGRGTPAPQKPDAPAAPTLTVKNESLEVLWTAPADNGAAISDYDVQHRVCTATPTTCVTNPAWGNWTDRSGETTSDTATSVTITGLTNGTAYQVQVRAANSAGDSGWSASGQGIPAPQKPDIPAAPTLTVKNQALDMSWEAPSANGSAITGYDVQYRACTATPKTCVSNPAWGDWTSHSHSGTGTTATIGSLTNGTSYQVQVKAESAAGDSGWSSTAEAAPGAQSPDAPAAPTVTAKNESLDVSWTAPSTHGAPVTGYSVQYRIKDTDQGTSGDQSGSWVSHSHSGTGVSTTIGSLTNNTVYQVQVQATSAAGGSGWSASGQGTPAPQKPDAPAVPTLTVKNESLDVSWTAPSGNGAAISDYDVQHRVCTATPTTCVTNPAWGNWTDRSGETASDTATSVTITGLTNGTAYQVQVRAANSVGASGWSASAQGVPAPQKPDAPAAPTLTVKNESLDVSWSAPSGNGAAISDYNVRHRVKDTDGDTAGDQPGAWASLTGGDDPGIATTATITGLTNDTDYQVQVQAVNSVGGGVWSPSAEAAPTAQKPDAPAAPTLTFSDRSLGVSWTVPAANGAEISDYDVQYRACTAVDETCESSPAWGNWTDRTGETTTDTGTSVTISGLTNGTAYQVQVRAANSLGDSSWSSSASEKPSTVPDAPGAPVLTVNDQSLGVSWSAPSSDGGSDVTGYKAGRCSSSCGTDANWTVTILTGANTSTTISGLTNGTAYQMRIAAVNRSGDSAWSTAATATPAKAPDTPAAPTVTEGMQRLSASWAAPSANGAAITDYDVQYRACTATPVTCTTNPAWGDWTDRPGETASDTTTSVTITGLTNGTAYQVQIRASNSVGDSGWSPSGEGTPAPQPPDTPAVPTVSAHSDTELDVSWSAPGVNGSAITGYDMQYRACTATPLTCAVSPAWGAWTSHTHTGTGATASVGSLTNGTAYQVQVKAKSGAGDSGWSSSGEGTPAPQPPDTPAVPTVSASSDTELDVSWSASGTNGSAITGYDVQYRECTATPLTCTTTPTWGTWTSHSHTGTGTTATIESLTNGTAYQIQVKAESSAGDSGWSPSGEGTPAPQPPDTPAPPTVSTSSDTELDVSWSAPGVNGSAITGYDVQYRACTATPLTCAVSPAWGAWASHSHTGTGTAASVGSLTNGTAYQVQVKAKSGAGDSGWSSSGGGTPAPQPPDTPAAPTVSTSSDTELDVSWSASGTNGSAITGYDVQYRECTATPLTCTTTPTWGTWTSHSHTGTGTIATIESLTNGTAYQIQVKAESSAGDSGWSPSGEATPAPQPPDTPAAPTVSASSDTELDVIWSASGTNGSAITGYDVQYRECTATPLTCTTTPTWGAWTSHSHTGTGTAASVGSLTNGTAYQVQVKAKSGAGDSGWSLSGEATPAPQPPDTPAAPTVSASSDTELDVSWSASGTNGSAITGYDVQYRECTAADTTCTTSPTWGAWASHSHTGTGTAASVGSLTNGTAYQVQVKAKSGAGDSGWSLSGEATPAPQPPDTPAAPTVSASSDTELDVSWSASGTNGSAITGYDVQYRECTATPLTCTTTPAWGAWTSHSHTGTGTTASVGSLTNGTAYQVQVKAKSGAGDSGWSPSGEATPAPQPPDTPAAPTVSASSDTELDVSWSAPGTNGSAITGYDVQYRECTATPLTCTTTPTWGAWTSHSHTGTGTTASVGSLTNGTAYQVQVKAKSGAGDSGWSPSGRLRLRRSPRTRPPLRPFQRTATPNST